MSSLPLTKNIVSAEKEATIRKAVMNSNNLEKLGRLATEKDAKSLTVLLKDPLISNPIYNLPNKINQKTITEFIQKHLLERKLGEGLLMIRTDKEDAVCAYYDIKIWPQWAACSLGGAIRHDHQNSGEGGSGAATSFNWLFNNINIDLICETCSLENIRTAKLLERVGFTYKGEIKSKLPNGNYRPSLYWELEKENWRGKIK